MSERLDCPHVSEVRDLHDQELPPAREQAVRTHLEACACCRAELAELERFSAALQSLDAVPSALDGDHRRLRGALLERCAAEAPAQSRPEIEAGWRSSRPAVRVAAAAAAACGLLAVFLVHPAGKPRVAAAPDAPPGKVNTPGPQPTPPDVRTAPPPRILPAAPHPAVRRRPRPLLAMSAPLRSQRSASPAFTASTSPTPAPLRVHQSHSPAPAEPRERLVIQMDAVRPSESRASALIVASGAGAPIGSSIIVTRPDLEENAP